MVELTKTQKEEVKKEVKREVEKEVEKQVEEKVEKEVEKEVKKDRLHLRAILAGTAYLGSQYKQQVSTAIVAAFGFLIALTWRDLITLWVNYFAIVRSLKEHPYLAQLYSVAIITAISVTGIIIVSRWAQKPPEI